MIVEAGNFKICQWAGRPGTQGRAYVTVEAVLLRGESVFLLRQLDETHPCYGGQSALFKAYQFKCSSQPKTSSQKQSERLTKYRALGPTRVYPYNEASQRCASELTRVGLAGARPSLAGDWRHQLFATGELTTVHIASLRVSRYKRWCPGWKPLSFFNLFERVMPSLFPCSLH